MADKSLENGNLTSGKEAIGRSREEPSGLEEQKLLLEKEKLNLEQKKFDLEKTKGKGLGWVNVNFGIIITAMIGIGTIVVSIIQAKIAANTAISNIEMEHTKTQNNLDLEREKEKLNESADLRKFQLDITKLLLEHAGEVDSAEDSKIDYYRSVAFSLLPKEYRDPIIRQLAINAPSDHAKAHWAGIAVAGRLEVASAQNNDKQAIGKLKTISADFISDRIGPLHEPSWRERITELFNAMHDAGINNPTSIINFFAYVLQTSGAFTELVENLNYSSQALLTAWPIRFNHDTAAEFEHQPEKIANLVYAGRLGNVQPGDGWRYRGRGYTQITGRASYATVSTCASANLVDNPDLLVTDRQIAAKAAVCDFQLSGSLPFAAQDDLAGVAYHMNGGFIGLANMQIWKQKMVPGSENVTSDLPSTNTISRNGN